ncbi:BQ2448_3265 [Microbotryum intermedium]|uniref:DNA primase large subunit n=1 Tax=Microbotryum intermedium TaxID=269621 RepID=A0A238FEP6_9BASI|nr:BQ2448_3265 [Microbotryum intermedium]
MYAGKRAPLSSRSLNNYTNNSGASTSSSSAAGGVGGVAVKSEVTRHSVRSAKYPHRLNFYERPPLEEITIEQFEEWAIDRLRLLADIEAAQARNKSHEDIRLLVLERSKAHLPLSSDSIKSADVETERKKDLYSHFVLRLAFCRSEELRQRFLRVETVLFKIRYESDDVEDRRRFIESLNFGWDVVGQEEKMSLGKELAASSWMKEDRVEFERFFKVDWTQVTDLVARRAVYLQAGKAYVPHREELSLVLAEFSARLSRGLEQTAKALPRLDEDSRLLPVLEHLSMGFEAGIASEYTFTGVEDGETIRAEMVPALSQQSFPMCMRSLQETLKSSKHLKHEGRLQYNLFLKGIGLSVEEAIVFWRQSFSNITADKFKKDYQYNIRHGYGLEGSRKNYAPRSCSQIIMGVAPGPGQVHGCPFRHYDEANLQAKLQSTYGLDAPDTREIMSSVKGKHYHVACTRLFEIQHSKYGVVKGDGIGKGDSVDHPNKYFDRSRALVKEKTERDGMADSNAIKTDAKPSVKREEPKPAVVVKPETAEEGPSSAMEVDA